MACIDDFHNELVGITDRECACDPSKAGINVDQSRTGVWIDQYYDTDYQAAGCDTNYNKWKEIDSYRTLAYKEVQKDILREQKDYDPSVPFTLALSKSDARTGTYPTGEKGLRLKTYKEMGFEFLITKIDLWSETAGATTNLLVKDNDGITIHTEAVTMAAIGWNTVTIDKSFISEGENTDRFVYFTRDDDQGKLTDKTCTGCGGQNTQASKHMSWNGGYYNGTTWVQSAYTYGVRPHIKGSCKMDASICNFSGLLEDSYAAMVAIKTAILMLGADAEKVSINKDVHVSPEAIADKLGMLMIKYDENIDFIKTRMTMPACFTCGAVVGMSKNYA